MNARSQLTTPQALKVADLSESEQREMYALYEHYYAGSSWQLFSGDLSNKSAVLTLRDESGALQGFSTLAVYERHFNDAPVRVIFSGDTIVHEQHWGQQAFAFAWLRLAGQIKSQQPMAPLYWLLISKGHRTYRYLPAFSRAFHPCPNGDATNLQPLRDFLASDRFGKFYDAHRGVLRFPESRGHLRERYAGVPETHSRLPEVAFFLEKNPGFAKGDELVCICELSAEQLQPIARRAFLAGSRSH